MLLQGNDKRFIARGDKVMCLPLYEGDEGIKQATVAEVFDEKHVVLRYGFLDLLSRENVPIEKLVRL